MFEEGELDNRAYDVESAPWYFGELGRVESNEKLERAEEGTFLVRMSSKQQQYVISLR